ncbi:CAF17-like 4Fe-4S cluster assembly/insertion protein YgfZ [Salinisphaera sp. SWV1]|uniref:CAF17-like 4Fe-4S cluster assembly/insertion protein YgfZ n=1 Tax=Salinisphaera sp. SWV1 TaxID=3454139 RepID=UPI003F854E02
MLLDALMGDDTPTDSLRLGVIRVTGPDAGEFLRAQLSNDVSRLGPDRHFLAAWCDAKGRTQLVLRVVATPEAYLLLLPQSLIASALKRLRMFVLRSKVELADVGARYGIVGLHDADAAPQVNETAIHDGQIWLGLPGSAEHPGRTLVLHAADTSAPDQALAADSSAWLLSDIDAGVPQVTAATQGEFVPQMLNLHWLMAVDFDKGCYPGQEVIARLHYRGRLTRRVFRLAWTGTCPMPGEPVHDETGDLAGQILQAAGDDAGRALAVLKIEAAARNGLRAEHAGALTPLALPYPTPD